MANGQVFAITLFPCEFSGIDVFDPVTGEFRKFNVCLKSDGKLYLETTGNPEENDAVLLAAFLMIQLGFINLTHMTFVRNDPDSPEYDEDMLHYLIDEPRVEKLDIPIESFTLLWTPSEKMIKQKRVEPPMFIYHVTQYLKEVYECLKKN